jgi:hypothetical protein
VSEVLSRPEEILKDVGVEVYFDEIEGRLEMSCERGSFELIRDLILGLSGDPDVEPDVVRILEIRDAAAIAEVKKRRGPRLFFYGCLKTILGVMVAAVIGVVTIVKWIVHR